MIYDRLLKVYSLGEAASPLERKLAPHSTHYGAYVTVYHRTHYASLQAGQTVDLMMQIPRGMEILAGMYAIPEDGHVYQIAEAQPDIDEDGLPVYNLSLHREDQRYDILGT